MLNKKELAAMLPPEIGDSAKVIDKGDKFEIQHGYIEDNEDFVRVQEVLINQIGARYFGYYAGAAHYELVKTSNSEPEKETEEPEEAAVQVPTEKIDVTNVAVDSLSQSPFWCRSFSEDDSFKELVESVKTCGIVEPVVARWSHNKLEVVAGHRRWLAAGKAGLSHIPVAVRKLTDEQAIELQFAENIHRKDLDDMEKAQLLKLTMEKTGYTQEQLAEKLGKSQSWVSRHLSLLSEELRDIMPRGIKTGELTEGQAREILKAPEEKREEILKQAKETGKIPSMKKIQAIVKPKLVQCEACPLGAMKPVQWHGHTLCPNCHKRALLNPEVFEHKCNGINRQLPAKPSKAVQAWKDTWEHRKASMQVKVSKFETAFDIQATKEGLPFGESHVPLCIRQTVPDKTYRLPKGVLHVYFDGPVHEGHEDKDDALRDMVRKRGDAVLEIKHKGKPADKNIKKAIAETRSQLIKLGWTPEEA